jgi:hypothetical protein
VAYALDPGPFQIRRGAITVGLDEARRGETRWAGGQDRPIQSAALAVDPAVIVTRVLRALTPPPRCQPPPPAAVRTPFRWSWGRITANRPV